MREWLRTPGGAVRRWCKKLHHLARREGLPWIAPWFGEDHAEFVMHDARLLATLQDGAVVHGLVTRGAGIGDPRGDDGLEMYRAMLFGPGVRGGAAEIAYRAALPAALRLKLCG